MEAMRVCPTQADRFDHEALGGRIHVGDLRLTLVGSLELHDIHELETPPGKAWAGRVGP
jgi:hypothetical protein